MSKFEETGEISLPIGSDFEKSFIYFLLQGDEVVYVGQTRKGLSRPFTHDDKIYDNIKILFCDKDNLNMLEAEFIVKYEPIYNKVLPVNDSIALRTAWLKFKSITHAEIPYRELRELCSYFEVPTYKTKSGKERILNKDFEKLLNLTTGGI